MGEIAKIIDGKALANNVLDDLKQCVNQLKEAKKRAPKLIVIQIGDIVASSIYVRNKQKACANIGFLSEVISLQKTTTNELLALIDKLNQDKTVDGILVQLPLPETLDKTAILERIDPKKDVDGFHPYNIGRLLQREPILRPCTPFGIVKMLQSLNQPLAGLKATIVGASSIVGRPMALELLLLGITPTITHSKTLNLKEEVKQADIVIACAGIIHLIQGDWIKKNAIVIDVGIHRKSDGKLCGDIDFESALKYASHISPVPGGVGPMTVAMLMQNTWLAYQLHQNKSI